MISARPLAETLATVPFFSGLDSDSLDRVTRGMRTLALRMQAATTNAQLLAERLAEHRAIDRVRYPGLATDPDHGLAASFMTGFGAMISFDVARGAQAADAVCRGTREGRRMGGYVNRVEQEENR